MVERPNISGKGNERSHKERMATFKKILEDHERTMSRPKMILSSPPPVWIKSSKSLTFQPAILPEGFFKIDKDSVKDSPKQKKVARIKTSFSYFQSEQSDL